VDVEELINSQDVDVYDKDGKPCHDLVLDKQAAAREEHPHHGTNNERFKISIYKY
jgi:hypothetical protein